MSRIDKLIENIYIALWTVCTLGMMFGDSYIFSYAAVALVVSQIFFLKYDTIIFNIFLLSAVAWGASLNLEYRFGNIMMSDIALLILLISIIVHKKLWEVFMEQYKFLMICIVLWFCLFGFFFGNNVSNIFQDLKLFLYIFVPYCYLCGADINDEFLEKLIRTLKLYAFVVFLMELNQLLDVGLDTMVENGFGNRDVSIIVHFVPLVACYLFIRRGRESKIVIIIMQIICFAACLLSFTRTIWITYMISIVLVLIFGDLDLEKSIKNVVAAIVAVICFFLVMKALFPETFNDIFNAVLTRINGSTSSNNTLDHRIEQSIELLNTKVLRPLTIIGAGFGEITSLKKSVFMENSILYYFWKYGLFLTVYLTIKFFNAFIMAMHDTNSVIRAVSISLLIACIIGNFSGNLNLYYFVPSVAFVFAYPTMSLHYDEFKTSDLRLDMEEN